eukprot:scaffold30483_cov52-Attheya_sp.AAC.4
MSNIEWIGAKVPEADVVVSDDVSLYIICFLDFLTLVKKKAVCRSWEVLFTNAIRRKALIPKAFQSTRELKETVDKYLKYNLVDAEEFAQTYGWPIDSWDVSNVEDFGHLFNRNASFDKNIGSWDLSNAIDIRLMLHGACAFNQDIASWDTSNVSSM